MDVIPDQTGTIDLIDGTSIGYRPIAPADAPALQRFHARLSNRSIYQRFFRHQPVLSDTQARYFTELDGVQRFALVALDPLEPDEIAGVIRFERDVGTDRAEYAAVVADRWQGKGLGLALTWKLIDAARQRGVRVLYALVLFENARMINLFRDLQIPMRVTWEQDVEQIELFLDQLPINDTPAATEAGSGAVTGL